MQVGIIANPNKQGAAHTITALTVVLQQHGIATELEHDTARIIGAESPSNASDLAKSCDVIAVLGGDGTMLNAAHRIGPTDTPLAGINIGTLGFLTSCKDDELHLFAEGLLEKSYKVVPRIMLKSSVIYADGKVDTDFAVNEITLSRGQTGRLISLDAYIDGALLNHYHADGLIVSTPTGSTAYSLAAGGPLISPIAKAFVITPICPHSLTNRSLVLDEHSEVELVTAESSECASFYSIDGREVIELPSDARVQIKKADHQLHILRLKDRSYFSTLREKLHWG
ncbi:NAD(+)/NADH kinase [Rubritalea spongiae]|uniref:NAD kinase n=1 Tax=Rubritalea spongiae TaxID=430797 RepID=A0ABW5DYM3_9BACT